ncbi:hypothetical protein H6769_04395 [Candidatus Peribacteria bacterium]|nr:hypothetical protein [Candidatus Peribacteria bacterium]
MLTSTDMKSRTYERILLFGQSDLENLIKSLTMQFDKSLERYTENFKRNGKIDTLGLHRICQKIQALRKEL